MSEYLNKTLPDKFSELILVALADLEKTEADPNYRIDMDLWHDPNTLGTVCRVCFAGAVMAQGGVPKENPCSPSSFDHDDTRKKLYALNELRSGRVSTATGRSDLEMLNRYITPYYMGKEKFKEGMQQLATDLKEAGL